MTFLGIIIVKVRQRVFPQDELRSGKLLNVFNIIKFPNSGCTTNSNTVGTCYSASECSALGGSSSGSCASGFGICCAFSKGCGSTISVNNTYFRGSSKCGVVWCGVLIM